MAYRKRSTSRTRSAVRRKSGYSAARKPRRNARVRRAGSSKPQTIRIVVEQAAGSAIARPGAFMNEPAKTKKAQF